ncbi:MAG: FkbM family methyltransferase [Thermosphaera sp.]
MTFISYAQNFEDVMLYRALKHIEKGFYIDVGAHDPVVDSVTRAFYERGWRGINIEPVPAYFNKLVQDRPEDVNLMVVVGKAKGLVTFYEIVGTGLSTAVKAIADHFASKGYAVREHRIPCLPLAEICAAYDVKEIHFLKIDVEGMEQEVIEGCHFVRFRPWIIVIEAVDPVTQKPVNPVWETILFKNNYEFVYYDGLNRFYLARERSELKNAFASPPTVFDSFVRYSEWCAQSNNHRLQAQLTEMRAKAEAERADFVQQVRLLQAELNKRDQRIGELITQVSFRDEQIKALEAQLTEVRAKAEAERADFVQQVRLLQAELNKRDQRIGELSKQVEELNRWLQAVYASTSWRITAPLRWAKRTLVRSIKGLCKFLAGFKRMGLQLALRCVRGMVRWAAQKPRLRAMGKKLLSRSPTLKACVRRLIGSQTVNQFTPTPQGLQAPENLLHLPEFARRVYRELKEELERAPSKEPP